MFGKTRLGKSNVVKLLAQSLIETQPNVGQLIFDINGEYANDNPQDGNRSLASGYAARCQVYALTPKPATPSRPLKLNFYQTPESSLPVLASLLQEANRTSAYINAFASVELPSLDEVRNLPMGSDKVRLIRKLQMFWAVLMKAGFAPDEPALLHAAPTSNVASGFDPGFRAQLRTAAHGNNVPAAPNSLATLIAELEAISRYRRNAPQNDPNLRSTSGGPLFEADENALLDFLEPPPGRAGVALLLPFRMYHDAHAGHFIDDILDLIDHGQTVILDLGNANPKVMQYFSDALSKAVFNHQVDKFSNNNLGDHFVQLYFEEAHNLFPRTEDVTSIYSRFAKEGAKYHIGMVYSTQSPTTINRDLLAQTENFFIAHLSSRDEVAALGKLNVAYDSMQDDILSAKTPGYIRMLTRSHRFVVSVQVNLFQPPAAAPAAVAAAPAAPAPARPAPTRPAGGRP
jgi:hypothetical protein